MSSQLLPWLQSLSPLPVIFIVIATVTCLVGDHLLDTLDEKYTWQRATVDNATHGLVALFSWAAVIDLHLNRKDISTAILCGVVGSFIDLDHFIAAKSLKLELALSLHHRPPFHATTLVIAASVVLFILQKLIPNIYTLLPLLVLVAGLSHHIRDGTRRGLWFPPFGNTPPIPYWIYIGMIMSLPLLSRLCVIVSSTRRLKTVDVSMV